MNLPFDFSPPKEGANGFDRGYRGSGGMPWPHHHVKRWEKTDANNELALAA